MGDPQALQPGVDDLAELAEIRVRGCDKVARSAGSRPAITCRSAAQSAADLAIGPTTSAVYENGMQPAVLTSPNLGFTPVTPMKAAGIRMLPRVSVPRVAGAILPARAMPLPLLEPPAENVGPQGLRPHTPLANSPQCRWPIKTIPEARRRAHAVASAAATLPSSTALSAVSGSPAAPITSLRASGRPVSGPAEPLARSSSARKASSAACCS